MFKNTQSDFPEISISKVKSADTSEQMQDFIWHVTNNTEHVLTIFYNGSTNGGNSIISPGSTKDIVIPSGSYRVVGSVDAESVRSYGGTINLDEGFEGTSIFYIRALE